MDVETSGNPIISVATSYKKLLDNMYALIDHKELDAFVSMLCSSGFIYIICANKMKLIGMELESRLDSFQLFPYGCNALGRRLACKFNEYMSFPHFH